MSGYNGWRNYETWNVALWLDNDEGTYHYVRELAEEHDSPYELGYAIQTYVEEFAPDLGASMFADLLNAALSEVDYHAIATNVLGEQ